MVRRDIDDACGRQAVDERIIYTASGSVFVHTDLVRL